MSALSHLATLLQPGVREGARAMASHAGIDGVLADMEARAKSNGTRAASEDHQLEAVRKFWETQEIPTFRDAYLLSWGLCLPHRPKGPCVLEDRSRFQSVLDGVDTWTVRPSAYRRCYQGLVRSYFTYDASAPSAPPVAKGNWKLLRDYLGDRSEFIRVPGVNPDWVPTAIGNRQLFGADPCAPYVDQLLRGDRAAIDHLCSQLGIAKTSWFLRELVLAQVQAATKLGHTQFVALMPRLLSLLAGNEVLRDMGLVLILDRYVKVPGSQLNLSLKESSVDWWGNPWLPSNETRWGAVTAEARTMVEVWLTLEFIESFFTLLAEDGLGDPRRMNFWKRYVKAIGSVEFALGATARNSHSPDFVALRQKMDGLICKLDAPGTNNAFIMRIGNLVAVEFSGLGNAFYGYDSRQPLHFDTGQPLLLPVNAANSLKHSDKPGCILKMSHQDGIHNWDEWEQMFEATLVQEFGIKPGTAAPAAAPRAFRDPAPQPPNVRPNVQAATEVGQPYSRAVLNRFAQARGLQVDDKTHQGGSLWVRPYSDDASINKVLKRWGFLPKVGKGWWK